MKVLDGYCPKCGGVGLQSRNWPEDRATCENKHLFKITELRPFNAPDIFEGSIEHMYQVFRDRLISELEIEGQATTDGVVYGELKPRNTR